MKPKLIIHVGAGKTGSSSIQATLNTHIDALNDRGIHYFGLALERNLTGDRFPWQNVAQFPNLLTPDTPEALDQYVKQLAVVLLNELAALQERGYAAAVWSNESLMFQNEVTIHAAKQALEAGYEVEIIAYLRRHDNWAKSAYAQWGIKHKTYEGPLKTYEQWRESFHVAFAPYVLTWQTHFADRFNLRNFDEIEDVSVDFLTQIDAADLPPVRAYDTPSLDILAAWAVYNARHNGQVMPNEFERLINSGRLADPAVKLPPILRMLPSEAQMQDILDEREPDIDTVNKVLDDKGQPPFGKTRTPKDAKGFTAWDMDQLMLKLIYQQREMINHLQAKIEIIERRLNDK